MSAQLNSGAKLKITNGTDKIDRVAYRDLMFWLPYKKEHLRDGIPYAPTFEDLIRLLTAQIDYILSIIAKNIRKNRKVGGERFSNCSLKVKLNTSQRIIRKHFAEEAAEKNLLNVNFKARTFEY